jgi:uncharacterized membrane protein
MSLDSWLHFFHVLAAIVWLGGGVMLVAVTARVRSSASPQAMTEMSRTIPWVGMRILGPTWLVVLVTGVWMVAENGAFKFSQLWVLIGLGAFAVAFLIGTVFMSRAGIGLERASRTEGAATQLPALLQRWLAGYVAILAVLLIAVADMVFKPGL